MGFLDSAIEDAGEILLAPDGEQKIECLRCEIKTSQAGNEMLNLRCRFPLLPDNTSDMYVTLVHSNAFEGVQKVRAANRIKACCEAFDVDPAGFTVNEDDEGRRFIPEFEGKSCFAIIKTVSSAEYDDKNDVKEFVAGH